jgi:glycosyltransferase involved in cell wall biosynthesis
MRILRILHVVTRSQRRGAELVALELAGELRLLGHGNDVLALFPGFDGRVDPELPALTRRKRTGPVARLEAAARLRPHLRRLAPDIVLAHGGTAAAVVALVRPRPGPRAVWQRILPFPRSIRGRVSRAGWRWVARRMDAAVALTADLAAELRDLGFTGPIWQIPNFRRPDRFEAIDRTEARARLHGALGLGTEAPLVGFVGHLVEQKRPEVAVAVLRDVHARGVPAHLVVAGDGPRRAALAAAARDAGLLDYVHLLGERRDVEWVLGGVDVLVLTSGSEGLPGILLEAAFSGCPVVSFAVGGIREMLGDDEAGMVVPDLDVAGMAGRVVDVLASQALQSRITAAARHRARRFTTPEAAERYLEHFRELTPG